MFLLLSFIVALIYISHVRSTLQTSPPPAGKSTYTVWCVDANAGQGCLNDAKPATTEPGVVLMGGGTDTDEAFMWQIKKANGGDFVVLRASGDDAYNQWILDISVAMGFKLNSVRTILFKSKEASSDPDVLSLISNAEAVFFAGGDQSDYTSLWMDTQVQSILQDKVATTTMGGTSAGCAIEGNWIYTGETGSITSEEALLNPYHRYMTLTSVFLHIPFLESFITDTHFVTRDRMGRMLTFTARILKDQLFPAESSKTSILPNGKNGLVGVSNVTMTTASSSISLVRAVGIDEHTALLLDINTGDVDIVGVGTAYVCTAAHVPEVCEDKTPLTFSNLSCTRLDAAKKDTFSFSSFAGTGVAYTNNIVEGVISGDPYGPK